MTDLVTAARGAATGTGNRRTRVRDRNGDRSRPYAALPAL
ncbi:hypothetical protein SALBM135S_02961 [Streptomyces alboniger]